jgi:hypothetical protein
MQCAADLDAPDLGAEQRHRDRPAGLVGADHLPAPRRGHGEFVWIGLAPAVGPEADRAGWPRNGQGARQRRELQSPQVDEAGQPGGNTDVAVEPGKAANLDQVVPTVLAQRQTHRRRITRNGPQHAESRRGEHFGFDCEAAQPEVALAARFPRLLDGAEGDAVAELVGRVGDAAGGENPRPKARLGQPVGDPPRCGGGSAQDAVASAAAAPNGFGALRRIEAHRDPHGALRNGRQRPQDGVIHGGDVGTAM